MTRAEIVLIGSLSVALLCFGGAGGALIWDHYHKPAPIPPQVIHVEPDPVAKKDDAQVPQEEKRKPQIAFINVEMTKESDVTDVRCEGGARYDAMREAYDKGLPDPCQRVAEPEKKKPVKKKAKKSSVKKLQQDWQRAEQNFPFIFDLR